MLARKLVAKAELADWMDDISKMDKRITSKKSGGADKAKPLKSRKLPPVRGEKPTNSTTDGTSKQVSCQCGAFFFFSGVY
jgi:hypothetical protein